MVDLAPVLWNRQVYAANLADALAAPPAPLRAEWGDSADPEPAGGKMSLPAPTPRKGTPL